MDATGGVPAGRDQIRPEGLSVFADELGREEAAVDGVFTAGGTWIDGDVGLDPDLTAGFEDRVGVACIGDDLEGVVVVQAIDQMLAHLGCVGLCGAGVNVDLPDLVQRTGRLGVAGNSHDQEQQETDD